MSVIVLVHGAWHDPSCWEALAPLLEAPGRRVVAPDLPIDDPAAGFEDYARVVLEAAGDEDDVTVVAHSLGADALPLVASARPLRLAVYLVPRFGVFPAAPAAPRPFRDDAALPRRRDERGSSVWDPADAQARMYRALDPAVAAQLAARLRPQADVLSRPYPLTAPPRALSALIVSADDELMRPEWWRWVGDVLGADPIELPGGHFPMVERPAELAALLERLIAGAPAPA